jgi:hypothetical protein
VPRRSTRAATQVVAYSDTSDDEAAATEEDEKSEDEQHEVHLRDPEYPVLSYTDESESESEDRAPVVFKKGKGLDGLTLCHGRDTPGGHWFKEFKKRARFRIGSNVVVDWSKQERDQGWISAVVVEPDEEAEEQAKAANWKEAKVIYVRYEDGGGMVEPVCLNVQRVVETVAQVEALNPELRRIYPDRLARADAEASCIVVEATGLGSD